MSIEIKTVKQIDDIDPIAWNAIAGSDYPFLQHAFLSALENSGAVSQQSGWIALHQIIYQNNKLIGALPLYLKRHSWGEYVFDWSWAEAYQQNGLSYYPKLVSAIPYTPAEGPRLILDSQISLDIVLPLLNQKLIDRVQEFNASSLHLLFTDKHFNDALSQTSESLLCRTSVQFHWFNRHAQDSSQNPYIDFSDFLSEFNSRKRRSLLKERKRVLEQNITIKRYRGSTITPELWETFFQCYQLTYLKRSGHQGYLNREFFRQLANSMSDNILVIAAEREQSIIATALCFIGSDTLYGRYWGCLEDIDGLHFEVCYYQGVEFCIEHQLRRFDPGAQGEHKISRGFRPIYTHSWHYLVDARFQHAVKNFLAQEKVHLTRYHQEAEELLPFRKSDQ